MNEGTIVVAPTAQIGTITQLAGDQAQVLLRNGEIWSGPAKQLRIPQEGELDAAPLEVERSPGKPKKRRP